MKTKEQIDRRRARLLLEAEEAGATVTYTDELPEGVLGAYESGPDEGRIFIRMDMTTAAEASTLAHELEHAKRDDKGEQSREVEDVTEERAAHNLISARAYASAATVAGTDCTIAAAELDVDAATLAAYGRSR